MWNWLKSLFIKTTNPESDRYDIYKPAERRIYHYWDGQKMLSMDPMILYKRIMEVGPDISIEVKVANSISKDAGKAHNKLIERIRAIFQVKPFEEGGLTEVETAQLLDHFMTYAGMVKKNSSQLQTSPTGTSATSQSSSVDVPSTLNTSDSGLTESESPTSEPTKSQTEQQSLSDPSTQDSNSTNPLQTEKDKPC